MGEEILPIKHLSRRSVDGARKWRIYSFRTCRPIFGQEILLFCSNAAFPMAPGKGEEIFNV
jgi:hypothetical protein